MANVTNETRVGSFNAWLKTNNPAEVKPKTSPAPIAASLVSVGDKSWSVKTAANLVIKNNVLAFHAFKAIDCFDDNSCQVINNIAYKNFIGIVATNEEAFIKLEHNISAYNTGSNWNTTFTDWPPANNYDEMNTHHPYFPGFKNEELFDFHLKNNSFAKDNGDPTILDPNGTRSDIGAYGGEYLCILEPSLIECSSPD